MPKQTTVGQILINSILPKHLRDYNRVLDKKGIGEIMEGIAEVNDPELYRNVIKALHDLGAHVSQSTGSSFSIRDMQAPPKTRAMRDALKAKVTEVIERTDLNTQQKNAVVKDMVLKASPKIEATLKDELIATGNPFGTQIVSGSRGGLPDVRSMMVGDFLVTDHKDRIVPIPIMSGYSSGVDPAEYWAGTYGARKGGISTKLSTARTGFFGKQLVQAAHRSVVTTDDCGTDRGIPVEAADDDNVGTVLVESVAGIPAGTIIDSKTMRTLKSKLKDSDEIMVRSPMTCQAKRGVCAKCTGVRERGTLPEIGDPVGVSAAHAITERVTQAALNVKHTGGRAKADTNQDVPSGYDLINQLVQVPKSFKGGAAVASEDGTIKSIDKAPQGGYNILIGDKNHHVPAGFEVNVKVGDRVEAGDVMSEGIPNPAELVKHRGIGEGRLQFVKLFRKAMADSGQSINRRNVEMLARGMVNHIRVTDLDGVDDALPDDIVEYNSIERKYRPRYGARTQQPTASVNKYLERPIRQYSIGTRITKRIADDLKKHGVKEVKIHDDPPPFEPEMTRAMAQLSHAPDWQMRLGGSYLQRGLLEGVHRGRGSEMSSESYITGMARGKDFGKELKTKGIY